MVNLFQEWYQNSKIDDTISLTVDWNVYDVSNNNTLIDFDKNDISISFYESDDLIISNNSYGNYYIDSYFVLYSSQSINEYSTSICNVYNENYFMPNQNYMFENRIQFTLTNSTNINKNLSTQVYIAEQSQQTSLITNSPPMNGNCVASPQSVKPKHYLLFSVQFVLEVLTSL